MSETRTRPGSSSSKSKDPSQRSSRPSSNGSRTSSDDKAQKVKETANKAAETAKDAARQVKDLGKQAGDLVFPVFDGLVQALGGWDQMDSYIKSYNRSFFDFANGSFLGRLDIENKPTKLVLILIGLGFIQSVIPIFAWPLDFFARFLGLIFLYNAGITELQREISTSNPNSAKVLPGFLFDPQAHFGALVAFILPAAMFITPNPRSRNGTLAGMLCDSVFRQISSMLSTILPDTLMGGGSQSLGMIIGLSIAILFWIGYLGTQGSYLFIFAFLAISTVNSIGRDEIKADPQDPKPYQAQQIIWHNLLAIWLWRYLISAVEGLQIPGVVSVLGLTLHYLPSYFLWITGFLFAMIVTKKTMGKDKKADTWFANLLLGKSFKAKEKEKDRERTRDKR